MEPDGADVVEDVQQVGLDGVRVRSLPQDLQQRGVRDEEEAREAKPLPLQVPAWGEAPRHTCPAGRSGVGAPGQGPPRSPVPVLFALRLPSTIPSSGGEPALFYGIAGGWGCDFSFHKCHAHVRLNPRNCVLSL